jgi:hypothetical protein
MSTSSNNWNDKIEKLLNEIRLNSNMLSDHHKKLYFGIKNIVVYFKLPIIILSSLNAIIAVSLTNYLDQNIISGSNCLISFIIGILTSISLYLKIEDKLENENDMSKEYHKLGIDIYKILSLGADDRGIDGDQYLNNTYNQYIKLFERSNLNDIELTDKLKSDIDTIYLIGTPSFDKDKDKV